jgi:ABC-type multidrug transport system fused ATPase/permease subunit
VITAIFVLLAALGVVLIRSSKQAKVTQVQMHDANAEVVQQYMDGGDAHSKVVDVSESEPLVPPIKPADVAIRADRGIAFEDIEFKIPARTVLQKVSGHIKPGEMVAILGPSGM